MNLNLVQLIGRLTRNPELKKTKNGKSVVSFSVATNHYYKDASDKRQETTTFHNCIAWGGQAETIEKYFKKGDLIYLMGRIDNRTYEKKDGSKGYVSEVIVDRFEFPPRQKGTREERREEQDENTYEEGEVAENDVGIRVEDIPF